MQHARNVVFFCASLLAGSLSAAAPANPAFDTELLSIQQAWARVNYEMPAGDERAKAFDELEKRAENFTHQNPARPEALIWEGIIESSYAGAKGGLGALSLCNSSTAPRSSSISTWSPPRTSGTRTTGWCWSCTT